MLEGLPLARKFKSYVGCKGAAKKLERWLMEFEFTDIATANLQIDWTKAQKFALGVTEGQVPLVTEQVMEEQIPCHVNAGALIDHVY